MKPSARLLLWIEMSWLAVGVVLAAWCAMVLVEAHYYKSHAGARSGANGRGGAARRNAGARCAVVRRAAPVATGSWVARLDAPSVHLSATVLEGSDDGTLRHGAGHIEDTPFPATRATSASRGHRDTTFRPVRHLHVGDPLVITTADHIYRYRITKTTIVNPNDVYVLDDAGHPTLTLVTCYPFEFIGHAPRRFIVSADLIGTEARNAKAAEPGEPGAAAARGARAEVDRRRSIRFRSGCRRRSGGAGRDARVGIDDARSREDAAVAVAAVDVVPAGKRHGHAAANHHERLGHACPADRRRASRRLQTSRSEMTLGGDRGGADAGREIRVPHAVRRRGGTACRNRSTSPSGSASRSPAMPCAILLARASRSLVATFRMRPTSRNGTQRWVRR